MLLITILTLLSTTLAFTPSPPQPLTSDKTGNLTQSQLDTITRIIKQAQSIYAINQLNSMAKYIFTELRKIYQIDCWSTYIMGNATSRVAYIGQPDLQKYLWRTNYGKYNLTYIMWRTGTCWKEAGGGMLAEFGESVNATLRDKLVQIVNNSILYRGDNLEGQAQYINDKTKTAGFGGWTAIVSDPDAELGFYECRLKEFWGHLRSFGHLKFNYYISRP